MQSAHFVLRCRDMVELCYHAQKKLQIIQNKCLKIIKNRYGHWRYSTFSLHQETKVLMIEAFGEKIYEKFIQRCKFSENPLILDIVD
jgi:hypothetical protein